MRKIGYAFIALLLVNVLGCNTGRVNAESPVLEPVEEIEPENVEPAEREDSQSTGRYQVVVRNDFVGVTYSIADRTEFVYVHLLPNNEAFGVLSGFVVAAIRTGQSTTILALFVDHERRLVGIKTVTLENGSVERRDYDCRDSANREVCEAMQERYNEFYEIFGNEIEEQIRIALLRRDTQ